MIEAALQQLLVTVWLAGAPVAIERLPHVYPATDDRCAAAAVVLRKHIKPGVKATVECVPARPEA